MRNQPNEHTPDPGRITRQIADRLGWAERTVLDVWRARNPYLARLVRQAYIRRCCRDQTSPVTMQEAVDDVTTELGVARKIVLEAWRKCGRDQRSNR